MSDDYRADFGPFGAMFRGFARGWNWAAGPGFERGDMRFLILSLLENKPMHGYEVMRELERRFDGRYAPSAGTVYPTLQLLEELGYVSSAEEDGRRRVYTITDDGRAHLNEHRERVDAIWTRTETRSRASQQRSASMEIWREFALLSTTIPQLIRQASPAQATQMRDAMVKMRRELEDLVRAAPVSNEE